MVLDDINFNDNEFNRNDGSPYNRSVIRSSHHSSFANDYGDNYANHN